MKFFHPPTFSLTGAVFLGLALISCEKPASVKETGPRAFPDMALPLPKEGPYSIKGIIHDNTGRGLDCTIVGRTADKLFVTRKADRLNVEIPLASLADKDRAFAEKLALQTPPADFRVGKKGGSALTPSEPSGEPLYIKNRLEAIQKLEKNNEILKVEAESTSYDTIKRSQEIQVAKNKKEIAKLRASIERYRSDHP